jgi:hypothetical protein
MRVFRNIFAVLIISLAAGCTTYYEVTDPTTGKNYFTTDKELDQSNSGAASFIDARTGDKVTIQNSQVAKITQQAYENGKNGVAPTPTTQP